MLIDSPYFPPLKCSNEQEQINILRSTLKATVCAQGGRDGATCADFRVLRASTSITKADPLEKLSRLYLRHQRGWPHYRLLQIMMNKEVKKKRRRRGWLARLEGWKNSCGEAKQRRVMKSRILVPRPETKTCINLKVRTLQGKKALV